MSNDTKVTLNKGGTKEKTLPISGIKIPDLWHIAENQSNTEDRERILLCWEIAHGLHRHILEEEKKKCQNRKKHNSKKILKT